jgi:hypothetical protein
MNPSVKTVCSQDAHTFITFETIFNDVILILDILIAHLQAHI